VNTRVVGIVGSISLPYLYTVHDHLYNYHDIVYLVRWFFMVDSPLNLVFLWFEEMERFSGYITYT